ncbi:DMT family transporter [Aminobacter sp. LjRoot7]
MMAGHILLAVLNGLLIGLSRSLNGRLGMAVGPMRASWWNHLVGFAFLSAALAVTGGWQLHSAVEAPPTAWLGGLFGALFVAANSLVMPRLGTLRTAVLVICGQMVTGLAVDWLVAGKTPGWTQFAGITLILLGTFSARRAGHRNGK